MGPSSMYVSKNTTAASPSTPNLSPTRRTTSGRPRTIRTRLYLRAVVRDLFSTFGWENGQTVVRILLPPVHRRSWLRTSSTSHCRHVRWPSNANDRHGHRTQGPYPATGG